MPSDHDSVDLWRKLLRDARHRLDKALHIGVSVLGPGGGLASLLSHVCPTLDPVTAGLVLIRFGIGPPEPCKLYGPSRKCTYKTESAIPPMNHFRFR